MITPSKAHPNTATTANNIPLKKVGGTLPEGLNPNINDPNKLTAIPITALSDNFSLSIKYDNIAPTPG